MKLLRYNDIDNGEWETEVDGEIFLVEDVQARLEDILQQMTKRDISFEALDYLRMEFNKGFFNE